MQHRIKISVLGCYHRDKDMSITRDLLPPKLNENKKLIGKPIGAFNFLDVKSKDQEASYGSGERKMESIINYIEETKWNNSPKPDIVTTKQLLTALCIQPERADAKHCVIHAVRISGVTFLLKANEDYGIKTGAAALLEHFFTKTSESEPLDQSGTVRKVVFNAEVPYGENGERWNVLYSGQIDACLGDTVKSCNFYDFKLNSGEIEGSFWKKRSCIIYWQSFFGKSFRIFIGSKQWNKKPVQCPISSLRFIVPQHSVYRIQGMVPSELTDQGNAANKNWSIKGGEALLTEFLNLVNYYLQNDDDCYVFEKQGNEKTWTVREDKRATADFAKLLKEKLGNLENH